MKSFRPGDIIEESLPFVHVLSPDLISKKCSWCFTESNLKMCQNCKIVKYCSISCQKKSWQIHKFECKKLLQNKIPQDNTRLFFQLLVKHKLGILNRTSGPRARSFSNLASNHETLYVRVVPYIKSDLSYCQGYYESIPSSQLLQIYCKLRTNSFHIWESDCSRIQGSGLYLNSSKYNHSCVPNATVTYKGIRQRIIAVDSFSDATITIAYIDLLGNKASRHAALSGYCFTCQCSRCSDDGFESEINATKCPSCHGGLINLSGSCGKCQTHVDDEYLLQRRRMCEQIEKFISDMEKNYSIFSNIEELLKKWTESMLPTTHVYYTSLKYYKSFIQMEHQDFKGALESMESIYDRLKIFYGISSTLSIVALKIVKCRAYLELPVEGRFYEETVDMVTITHGATSEHLDFLLKYRN